MIATTDTIAWGDPGVAQTLDHMAALVRATMATPIVVSTARTIVSGARTPRAQALAIRDWLAHYWRFVDDPIDTELLVAPDTALATAFTHGALTGDCDEAATLGAALGAAVGLEPVFTVLGFDNGASDRYCHVYASLLTGDGGAVSLDVTRPPSGVPAPTRSMTVSAL